MDDMLIISRDIYDINATKRMLQSKFDMKDLGVADMILGIRIHQTLQGLALSQSHYIEKVLDKFKYMEFGIAKTPLDVNFALQKNESESESDSQSENARVLGCLMYIMNCAQPDIACAITKLSRYTNSSIEVVPYFRQQVNYYEEISCPRILRWLSTKTDRNAKFLNLFNPSKEAVDVMVKATTEEHNITVDNPSTTSKEEEKVELVCSGVRKNCLFEGFNISDEAPKKLTQLIKDYSECIVDRLLKHHAGRYCQQKLEVFRNEECLINIIKGFIITAGLPWNLVDEVYIPINYANESHWVLAFVILKESHIRVYDSISRRRHFKPSSEIQKLTKILPTYLDMSEFLD
ncbi:hypothetical protein CQW23_13202 [Capsicum baccatum]|uniref:Ubiquitin-like protease family profile domain-containing protein n=1 Tax=Capsicum baccatum TaxID=33114 RepID=A0A2G2WUS0_CAPBA|nr:hypothetical protein CQW23_13202 [Capsicum baccatum]